MTLDTRVRALDPVDPWETFQWCRGLLGATDSHEWEHERGSYCNTPGQGLPAWLTVTYDPVEVSFDTGYAFDVNGARCTDLHAYLVDALGRWFETKNVGFSWYDELEGEWHPSWDALDRFGDKEKGLASFK